MFLKLVLKSSPFSEGAQTFLSYIEHLRSAEQNVTNVDGIESVDIISEKSSQ